MCKRLYLQKEKKIKMVLGEEKKKGAYISNTLSKRNNIFDHRKS